MTVFDVISLIIGLILFIICIYQTAEGNLRYTFPAVSSGLYLFVSIMYFVIGMPTNTHVKQGKAKYIQEHRIEIVNNDTIEYDIYNLKFIK